MWRTAERCGRAPTRDHHVRPASCARCAVRWLSLSGCRCRARSPGPGASPSARGRDPRCARRNHRPSSANEIAYGLRVASADSGRPSAAAIASSSVSGDRQEHDQHAPTDVRVSRRVRAAHGTTRLTDQAARWLLYGLASMASRPNGSSPRPLRITDLAASL